MVKSGNPVHDRVYALAMTWVELSYKTINLRLDKTILGFGSLTMLQLILYG